MKDNENNGKKAFSDFLHKASDVSQKIAKDAYEGTKDAAKKIKENSDARKKERKENSDARKKEKLDPITLEQYQSEGFHVPNIIKIVDDAVRRGNPLCEGAIGWRAKENETEVLFLYDEARKVSGLHFIPSFECDSIYSVDPFDKNRYIKVDCVFNKAQEERLAELENIAYCLGAKHCSITIISSESQENAKKANFSLKVEHEKKVTTKIDKKSKKEETTGFSVTPSISSDKSQATKMESKSKAQAEFQGHNNPMRPKLKWFAYDETIKNLIKMRCANPESVKSRVLELFGSSSATMNRQTAIAIDSLLTVKGTKSKVNPSVTMEAQATKELSSKLIFEVEF